MKSSVALSDLCSIIDYSLIVIGCDQEWLEQTSGGLWLLAAGYSHHDHLSPLEVLSDVHLCSLLPPPPSLLETTKLPRVSVVHTSTTTTADNDSGAMGGSFGRDLQEKSPSVQHDHLLMDCLRRLHQNQNPVPCSQSSLLESQDAYVTLNAAPYSQEDHLEGVSKEALPLEALFTSKNPACCDTHSDMGSVPQSSGSGRLSSQSSFEYPNSVWTAKGPGYTYMAAADSGVSMDYSPMSRVDDTVKSIIYANDPTYKNEMTGHEGGFC